MFTIQNLIHRTVFGLTALCLLSLCAWGAAAFTMDPTARSGGLHIASGGIVIDSAEILIPKPYPPDQQEQGS